MTASAGTRREQDERLPLLWDAASWLVLLSAVTLQWRVAAFTLGSSLIGGDPQKHFVTGVMVYDYLRTGLGSNPIEFAKNFEVRYPQVAIGHWPPLYYGIQAIYYLVAGPTIRSAEILSALTAVLLAALLWRLVRPVAGLSVAVVSTAMLLVAPLMQDAAWQVMSDLSTALFVFLAICSFSRFLENTQGSRAAIAFAVWGTAAILTKGSAWALGPFALLAPLLSRRFACFRSIRYWAAGVAIMILSAPFYLLTQQMGVGYNANYSHIASPAVGLSWRLQTVAPLIHFAPLIVLCMAVIGFFDAFYARWVRGDLTWWTTLSLVAGSWVAAQAVFLFFLPLTAEPRVLLPALAPTILLAARTLVLMKYMLRRLPIAAVAGPIALGALIVATAGVVPLQRVSGYREAANTMPYDDNGSLILVAAGRYQPSTEGALIAERLSHQQAHNDVMLRATHVLVQIDSMGNCRPLFKSADSVRDYLVKMPVRFIILGSTPAYCQYNEWMDEAVAADPADFHLIKTVPVVSTSEGQLDVLRIYENPAGRTHHPSVVRTPTGIDAGRRELELRWK